MQILKSVGWTGTRTFSCCWQSLLWTLIPALCWLHPGSNDYLGLEAEWEIQVRTLDVLPGPIQNQMSFQRFSIRLECVDGLWWVEGS